MSYADLKVSDFVVKLASKDPTPGGGGAAALLGALGTALGNMVGSLTLGKKKYAAVEEDIIKLKARSDELQDKLLGLIDKDAEVFEPLSKAYGLPTNTEEEKAHKDKVMEETLRLACSAPLEIMRTVCTSLDVLKEFSEKGTALAISDVGCGAAAAHAALRAASLNVFINTKYMKDKDYAAKVNEETRAMLKDYCSKADEIFAAVAERFKEK